MLKLLSWSAAEPIKAWTIDFGGVAGYQVQRACVVAFTLLYLLYSKSPETE
jgi:hypothetical protein